MSYCRRPLITLLAVLFAVAVSPCVPSAAELNRAGTEWYPFVEWSLSNTIFEGNPYDVEANVIFRHPSGPQLHWPKDDGIAAAN